MAWKAEIGGVDQTTNIDRDVEPVHVLKMLNERWMATFVCMPGFTPPRRTKVIFYAKDGVSRIFGGLVSYTKKWAEGPSFARQAVECVDFRAYADWTYTPADFGYTSPVTLLQILQDLVVLLAPFGVTLDPAQPTGPTFAPFSWPLMRLSDCFRALTDATGGQYVWQINASEVLSMTVPGSVSAPWTITDAAPHCTDLRVVNRDQNYASKVILVCGPTGVGTDAFTQTWTGQAGVYAYALDGVNVPAANVWPGVVAIDGATYPIWLPGEAPGGNGIEWDHATAGGTLSFLGTAQALITGGEAIALTYYPQYPFVVTADAAATPTVARKFTRTDILTLEAAQETADGLLDQLYQEPEELEIDTQDDGLDPGQALSVSTTAPLAVSMTALVTSVDITLQDDETWLYVAAATESAVYQQATQPLVYFRSLTGGGGSGGVVTISGSGGGSTTVLSSPFPLGGSREDPYPVGTTPTPVISWRRFKAGADMSVTVFCTVRAKSAGVGVTPVLQRWDSGSGTWVTHETGSPVTSTSETDQEFTVALTKDQIVRLAYHTDTAGASAYAMGQLEP